ncbi:hypothetical protein Lalb_Chr01g0022661 [Lupinus albus]|uniref:Uncharacterized protein n=1 Tax=Lupinus albus TaxID=3870 RepID=A0A6A4R8T3_LUPAL|nr:hypothetical protein Lalb_Chr01g0022661 [Lupinus albus]
MMFALGAKFDRFINNGGGPPTIRIQGQHVIVLVACCLCRDNFQCLSNYIFMIPNMKLKI